MIKRLLNLHTITKITLILTTLLLLPNMMRAEDTYSYGITVGGIEVTSENASNVLGDEKSSVSFTPEAGDTPATLTLNGANISGNISSSIDALNIHLIGSSTITSTNADDKPISYIGPLAVAPLTFESTNSEEGELTFNNTSVFSNITNYRIVNEFDYYDRNEVRWIYQTLSTYVKIYYNVYYGITIGSHSVSKANKDMVTDLSGSDFSYTPEDNTLHIPSNPSLSDYAIKSHRAELNVSINGSDCYIKSISFERNEEFGATSGTLTFKEGESGTDKLSLYNGEGGVITGFSDVNFETPMQLVSPSTKSELATATSAIISNFIEYDIIVADQMVTDRNADYVLGDNKISYDKQSNTLTLDGAELKSPIFIGRESLTIDLKGSNSIIIGEDNESAAIFAEECNLTIQSTTKTGSLTLSSANGCSVIQGITPTIIKPLVSSKDITNPEITYAKIQPVSPPMVANVIEGEENNTIVLCNVDANGGSGTIKYSISYADNSPGVTNQTCESELLMAAKPGTLTAWIELDSENKSSDMIGKFFGYKQKCIRQVFNGTDAIKFTPEIVPEIETSDNTKIIYEGASVRDNVISMSSFGSSMVSASFWLVDENESATYLNRDTIQVKVMAVPAAPSIPEDNSTFLDTDKITITSTAPSTTTICYKWDNGEEKTYSAPIAIEGTTLSAWVKYQANADAEEVRSDVITATYTVKTDITDYYVVPIENITYTGSAVTPTIVVKETNSADAATLTVGTDYEVSYKKGETAITADQLINVGTYTAVITGKGDFDGTTNQTFQIIKASANWAADSWTAPAVKTDLNYSGEAIDLITAGSSPQGTTIKYYTVFNPESYNYTESANEEWTTTVPKGTAVGDYAIFYKVEGGDNYENWGPSEEGIKVTIDKGLVSITAENMTSTYTGEPIDFDKNKVEISNTTISKNGISFKYYVPNAENPEEPTQLDAAPTEVGTYNVKIYLEDDNYTAESVSATLTISAKSITSSMVTSSAETFEYNGSTQKPTVTVKDAINGEETILIENEDFTISYQQVNGETTSTVTNPTNVGSYNVLVTGMGNYSGSVTKTFSITTQAISGATVTINPEANLVFDGTAKHPEVTKVTIAADGATGVSEKVFNAETDYDVSYSEGCTNVGEYTATVTFKGNYRGTATGTFNITAKPLTSATIATIANQTYSGNEIKPEPAVSIVLVTEAEATTLVKGTDFEYSYTNNTNVAASTDTNAPTVTITGKGNYSGTATKAFSITNQAISGATVTINPEANLVFDGTVKHPEITKVAIAADGATGVSEKVFNAETDYDVSYSEGCTNVGEYTATVTFKGNYSGNATNTFNITAKPLTEATIATIADQTYSGNEIKPEPAVSIVLVTEAEATTLVKGTDFEYSYTNNTNVAASTDTNAPTVTITGKGNYSGTATKTFSITTQAISGATVTINPEANLVFDGTAKHPEVTKVTIAADGATGVSEKVFNAETDYDVSYSEGCTNVGEYTATVTFKGNYSGTATGTFNITAKPLTSATIATIADQTYSGNEIKPEPAVSIVLVTEAEATTLVKGTDFEYSYTNNTNVAASTDTNAPTVTITGKGNYSGTATKTFSITTQAISGATVTINPEANLVFDGTAKHPEVTKVTIAADGATGVSEKVFNPETDYDVSYSEGCTNVGEYTATVTFKGNYSDTATGTFNITAKPLTSATIATIADQTYSGNEIKPEPAVSIVLVTEAEATTLVKGTDFEYSYTNNTNVAASTDTNAPTVTITGKGNYSGTATKTFSITTQAISGATVTINPEANLVFDGTAKHPEVTKVTIAADGATGVSEKVFNPETDYDVSYSEGCTNVGEYTATVTFKGNYSGTATTTFTITAATMTVTANGYEGTYDEKPHAITVTAPESATVKYGTQKGTYNLTESPTYTDAGTYMVHYQVTMDNYTTIADSATVVINKADISPTVTLEGWTYGATANTPSITGNTGNGTVTYTYKAAGTETFSETMPVAVGTHTIKATIAETTNYNSGEATTTFTISNPTFDPEKDITFAEGQKYASYYNANADMMLPSGGIAAYMITDIDGNTLITKAVSYIPKDTPVLIEKTEETVETENPENISFNMLKYAYDDITADGTLYILYNGAYIKATGTIPAGKCYLRPIKPSGARKLMIGNSNNGSTGIQTVDNDQLTKDIWFDLNGNRIDKPTKKGLYINNGKKVVLK